MENKRTKQGRQLINELLEIINNHAHELIKQGAVPF